MLNKILSPWPKTKWPASCIFVCMRRMCKCILLWARAYFCQNQHIAIINQKSLNNWHTHAHSYSSIQINGTFTQYSAVWYSIVNMSVFRQNNQMIQTRVKMCICTNTHIHTKYSIHESTFLATYTITTRNSSFFSLCLALFFPLPRS